MTSTSDEGGVAALVSSRQVLDALPRAIVITDTRGVICEWSAVAEALVGWGRAEVIGRPLRDLASPDSAEEIDALVAHVLGPERWRGPLRLRRADQQTAELWAVANVVLDDSGETVGVVVAADDFADVEALQSRTAQLAVHLQLAIDAGELGTWRWDRLTGEVVWDEAMERAFGLAPGTFEGTFAGWVGLLLPEETDGVLAILDEAISSRGHFQVDHRVAMPDGSHRWLHGRGMVTVDEAGEVTGAIGCTADITDRKNAEIDARRLADLAMAVSDAERLARERMEILGELTDAALTADDTGTYIHAVVERAVPRLGDWCAIYFVPEPGAEVQLAVAHADPDRVRRALDLAARYPLDPDAPSGVGKVLRTGEPEHISDVGALSAELVDEALRASALGVEEGRAVLDELGPTSVITMPLKTKRAVIGALQFVHAESGRHYSRDDVALANAVAGRVGDALESMWLTEQHRHISHTLQRALLPPALPTFDGMELAARYWPGGTAMEVGGDFYDAFVLDDRTLAVTVGDICGRGPDAAALTGMARHTIRAAATHGQPPQGVLRWLNDAFLRSNRDRFCTAVYCTLTRTDDGYHQVEAVAGGHPLPAIVRVDGSVERLGRPGTLLGVFGDPSLHVAGTPLHPHDVLVLFTDGITDVPPPHALDDEAVVELLAAAVDPGLHAEEIADRIHDAVAAVLRIEERSDDIAVVVIRALEPPADG